MKKYIVLYHQSWGCDRTIGCGRTWFFIEAKSFDDAQHQAITEFFYDDIDHAGMNKHEIYMDCLNAIINREHLYDITIIEIGEQISLDIKNEYKPLLYDYQQAQNDADERQQELAELDRLKAKYSQNA